MDDEEKAKAEIRALLAIDDSFKKDRPACTSFVCTGRPIFFGYVIVYQTEFILRQP